MPRSKPISYNSIDTITPLFTQISDAGIQDYLKYRIGEINMEKFLDEKIDETNVDEYRKLLEMRDNALYNITGHEEDPDISEKKKYLFDLALSLLYDEVFTFSQIESIMRDEGVYDAATIFEKIIILEYGLFYLNHNILETTKNFERFYIIDNIPELYYKSLSLPSYRNLTNLEAELQKIYDQTLEELSLVSAPSALPADFNYKALVRINGEPATIEGANMSTYWYILNYNDTTSPNVFDRDLLRKYYALDNDITGTKGYYYKDGNLTTKIYFTGIDSYSYYGLLSNSHNLNYQQARIFLRTFWQNILDGTINY
jgi:hypothetical protein